MHIRYVVLFSLLFFMNSAMAQEDTKLIYFADPMCSWCYGFSPELTKVKAQLGEEVEFEMVMGGLRPYNTQTMADLGDFLAEHWQQVAERSGQAFDYAILKDTSFVYDTEPACRAVAIVRELKPASAFDFFKGVQVAFYKNNQSPHLVETYSALLDELDIDKKAFAEAFESDAWKAKVKEDFQYSATIGVRGFPTLVLQRGKDLYLISNGYQKAEAILAAIERAK